MCEQMIRGAPADRAHDRTFVSWSGRIVLFAAQSVAELQYGALVTGLGRSSPAPPGSRPCGSPACPPHGHLLAEDRRRAPGGAFEVEPADAPSSSRAREQRLEHDLGDEETVTDLHYGKSIASRRRGWANSGVGVSG